MFSLLISILFFILHFELSRPSINSCAVYLIIQECNRVGSDRHNLCWSHTNYFKEIFMDKLELDRKKAPAWFWLALVLLVLTSIILYMIFTHDGRDDQRNTEKKTTLIDWDLADPTIGIWLIPFSVAVFSLHPHEFLTMV